MNDQIDSYEKQSSLKQITGEDIKIITNIIEELKLEEKAKNFLYPVDTKKYPEYLRIIKNCPMDISTIEAKLKNNEYALVQDVIYDIKLIWYNCRIFNNEGSQIVQATTYLEKLVDKKFEKYYIYFDTSNKSINYKEQYEKNIYNEESFNDPDYLEKNGSDCLNEKDKNYFLYLYYKVKLKKIISIISNEDRKILFEKINKSSNDTNLELNNLKKYIENSVDNNKHFKFHIEIMNKDDILFLISYIIKNFNIKIDENNY